MAKIEKQDAIDAVEAFVKDLAGWLDTPGQVGGSGLGACPISPKAKDILAGKVAALADAISKIPAAKRGWRQ
jgi:hypothetical protein